MRTSAFHTTNYFVLQEQVTALAQDHISSPTIKDEAIGFVFYNQGEMQVEVKSKGKKLDFYKKAGVASSFYVNPDSSVKHLIPQSKGLEKLTVFISPEKLKQELDEEEQYYKNHLNKLFKPNGSFVEGDQFKMTPAMKAGLTNLFHSKFTGFTHKLFMESQVSGLMFSYFSTINLKGVLRNKISRTDIDKLYFAKEILDRQLFAPPTLKELARLTQLNTFKLKTGFKEMFGSPVFQYVIHQRLEKAYQLIQDEGYTVQQAAHSVGYNSLGSFSNAFLRKYGLRPSGISR